MEIAARGQICTFAGGEGGQDGHIICFPRWPPYPVAVTIAVTVGERWAGIIPLIKFDFFVNHGGMR